MGRLPPYNPPRHRGTILVSLIVALVMLSIIIVGICEIGTREQQLTVSRFARTSALYAAEAGANMSLKELFDGVDRDGDGAVGTISNDSNAANDPSVSGATFSVAPTTGASGISFTVRASAASGSNAQLQLALAATGSGIEGFESYGNNFALNDPNGWQPWDSNAGAVAYVVNTFARSGAMSVDIKSTSDTVHLYTPTSGKWTLTAWQYIPSSTTGTDAYFILMNTYASGGSKSWSTQVRFLLGSNICYDNLTGGVRGSSVPIVRDQWIPISVNIDLDAGTQTVKYNNQTLFTDTWNGLGGVRALAAVDLFGSTASDVYYDDIQLAPQGASGGSYTVTGWQQVAPGP